MEGESFKGTEDCKLEFKENPLTKTFQSVFSKEKEKSITIPNKIYILSQYFVIPNFNRTKMNSSSEMLTAACTQTNRTGNFLVKVFIPQLVLETCWSNCFFHCWFKMYDFLQVQLAAFWIRASVQFSIECFFTYLCGQHFKEILTGA